MPRYFAYASNLDPQQMAERCPSARPLCAARLPDHQLTFPRRSRRWGGGVAGLESHEGAFVEGVVYELDEKDLNRLDGYEGVADHRYERSEVEVTALPGGEPIRAWCYFAVPEPGGPFAPSPAYARAILRGADAEENDLSAEGVKQLHEMIEQSMHSSTAPGR